MAQISTARVYAYCDTGFSSLNTPATPAVLASAGTMLDLGEINCLSLIGKKSGSIRVRDYAGIATTDYLRIVFSDNPINTYWIVTGYEYLSSDTLSISIVLDGFLTAGGTAGITSISGYVNRKTVTDDTYGKYNQADDMLVPSQNLIFRNIDKFALNDPDEEFYTIVLSTVNLLYLGATPAEAMGLTYGDVTAGEAVVVPQVPTIPDDWKTEVEYGSYKYTIPAGFCFLYDASVTINGNTTYPVQEGISRARSLGIEGGILAMYSLPKSKFTVTAPDITFSLPVVGSVTIHLGLVTKITSTDNSYNASIAFEFASVNNKRALYGGLEKVKVVSIASGEQAEYEIEDLYSPTAGNTNITIKEVADGRAHGKPIFYPRYFMDKEQSVDNMLSSVAGIEWQNVPLTFDYKSGEGIERIKYGASREIALQNMMDQQATAFAPKVFNAGVDVAKSFLTGGAFAGASSIINNGANLGQTLLGYESEWRQFNRSRELEKKNMLISGRVVAPEISFPVSESVRDFIGNGVLVALVTPTNADIARFDKILNMYGYKCAGDTLTVSDLSAGLHYTYIEASGVSIQSSIPIDKNIKEMAEAQIEAGIRIWKESPNFALYSQANR